MTDFNVNPNTIALTPVGRIAFEKHLFEADENGKFRAALIIDTDKNMSKVKAICKMAAEEKWGSKIPKKLILPYKANHDAETIEKYSFMEGNIILNAATKFEVPVFDRNNEELFKGDLKAGDQCRFAVSAWAWEYKGKFGVSLNLNGVQLIREDEAFYSRPSAKSIFASEALEDEDNNSQESTSEEEENFTF